MTAITVLSPIRRRRPMGVKLVALRLGMALISWSRTDPRPMDAQRAIDARRRDAFAARAREEHLLRASGYRAGADQYR